MKRYSIWQDGKRFGVEALCLLMVLYGAPIQALEQAGPVVAESPSEGGVWQQVTPGIGATLDAVTEIGPRAVGAFDAVVESGVGSVEKILGQPWTDALSILLATGAGEEAPPFLTDAVAGPNDPRFDSVPPLPPGFSESSKTLQRPGIPGLATSSETVLASKNHLETIPLLAGWNLLSIPEEPSDPDPAVVLASIAGSFDRAFAYDACDPVDPWKLFDPGDAAASDLLGLDPTQGFWIDASTATSLPSDGTLAPTTSWQLCTGWNLIGYPAGEPRHIKNALQSIEGKYIRAFGFDPADPGDPWEVWDIGVPDWANDLESLRPGFGYWILVTEDATLTIANQGEAPTVAITAPTDLGEITAPTEIRGTIQSPILDRWNLAYRSVGESDWIELATGAFPVTDAPLATFDPTLLLNGLYEIRLEALDLAGMAVEETIAVVVEGQMKIGDFSLTYIDLSLPFSGLELEIVRTYDTRQRQLQGDFGQGWTLEIRQGSYSNNRPTGEGWQILPTGGPFGLPCEQVAETKSHRTVIRLSDEEVYQFRQRLVDPAVVIGGCFARAEFEYVGGPTPGAVLEVLGNDEVIYQNESNRVIDRDTLEVYEPENVRLTTRDGRIFELNLDDGVTHLEDLDGNALEITPDGITHSTGRGVDFDRDGEGRIVRITDPLGRSMDYDYDAAGDLVTFTDRVGASTRFTYDDAHLLLEIEDARGVQAVRNEYDSDGRLVRHIDASGRVSELDHRLGDRQEIVTNRLGHTRLLEYDTRGNVIRELDELGQTTLRSYDGDDNLLSETDSLGRTKTFAYTTSGDIQTFTDAAGNVTRFTYSDRGQILTVTAPGGGVETNVYDSRRNLVQTTDAVGGVTSFTYDTAGNLLTTTDAAGGVTRYGYDAVGNRTSAIDPLGNEATSTYDAVGNRLTLSRTRTLPDGSTETLTASAVYDALDRPTQTTAVDGSTTALAYDPLGKVVRRTDSLGRDVSMTYDLSGRLATTAYPDGTSENRTYDEEGRLRTFVDRGGRTTTFSYDPAGQLVGTTFPDGSTASQTFDAAGQLDTLTDTRGNTTRFLYDAAGRRTQTLAPLGAGLTYAYDANDNITTVTDAKGQATNVTYDALDRPIELTFPDGTSSSMTYDGLGRVVARTDPEGQETELTYDAAGRLTSVRDALDQVTQYAYDEVGNRLSQTDANGHVTRLEHDRRGRVVRRVLPGGAQESMVFDSEGSLIRHTDSKGSQRVLDYDSNGQLARIGYPDGSEVTFTYTPTGQRASATDARGTTTYAYDDRDRLIEKVDPTGYRLQYAYDSQGNETELTATVGSQTLTTTYGYDALDRLTTVTDSQGDVTTLAYDVNGNRQGMVLPNGVENTYSFDALDRLVDLRSATSVGDVLRHDQLTRGAAGQRLRIDEHDGTSRHYQYDALYRLVQDRVTDPADALVYQRDFTYDPVGNRIEQTVDEGAGPTTLGSVYDDRDRLQSRGATSFGWDDNGNLLSRSGDSVATLGWDFENRLTSVELEDGTLVETHYDVDGYRVRTEMTLPDGSSMGIDYLVDPREPLGHVVAEVVEGSVHTLYTRAGGELLGLYRPVSGTQRYYLADGLGSIRALTDPTGAVTDRYTYTAYGELLDKVGSDDQPYRYAGEPFDSTTGLYYNRARWLDVTTGRFISSDTFPGALSEPQSLHRYHYASLNPVNNTDPTGLFSMGEISIANGIRGIVTNIQIDVGLTILTMPPLDPDGDLSKALMLASLAAGGFVLLKNWKSLLRAFKQFGQGVGRAARSFFDRLRNWARRADMSWPNGIPADKGLEMAQDLRQALNLKPMERNIAIAEVRTSNGRKSLLYSVSGQGSPPGTVPAPVNRRFSTRKVRGAAPTDNHSEVKILEMLADELPPDAKGTISLYTERAPCPSCGWPDPKGVIQQFEDAFPGIKVLVTQSY